MATTRAEQETVVTMGRDETVVRIWSNWPAHVRRMQKDPRFTDVGNGFFELPIDQWNPFRGIKRQVTPLSPEERAKRSERMIARLRKTPTAE